MSNVLSKIPFRQNTTRNDSRLLIMTPGAKIPPQIFAITKFWRIFGGHFHTTAGATVRLLLHYLASSAMTKRPSSAKLYLNKIELKFRNLTPVVDAWWKLFGPWAGPIPKCLAVNRLHRNLFQLLRWPERCSEVVKSTGKSNACET